MTVAELNDVELNQFFHELNSAGSLFVVLSAVELFNNKFIPEVTSIKVLTNLCSGENTRSYLGNYFLTNI